MMLLSLVIPTRNERDNIAVLLQQLRCQLQALAGQYEIIVVDDGSPDGTAAVVRQHMQQDGAVQLLSRHRAQGLSGALAAGFDAAAGDYVLALDADLQHDPAAVLPMLQLAQQAGADLVVATRYAAGGCTAGWPCWRRWLSRFATALARWRLGGSCSDPLSGFFLLRRQAWIGLRSRLQPDGFKLLLDILQAMPGLRVAETGYCFVARQRGSSKFGLAAVWAFLCALWRGRR
jgi:dolichol-phosphate mannosyltransferase